MEVCCSGARFTKQYNEPEKTLFPSCIRRFVCEWTEVSRHASRVWFVQCHHPLLQPPFVTHTVIFYIVFHAFSVLIGQKGCTAQDGEGKWKSPSAGSFKYLRERATSWAGNRKYIHLTWFPVKSEHFQNLITNGKKRLGVGMTTAPRGRSLTRSLPVERDSILDGLFQRLVELPLRELLCFCRISTVYQPFCRQKTKQKKQNVPFLSPWMCNTSRFSWRCNYIAVTLVVVCSSTCPGVIAPSPVCVGLAPPPKGGAASAQTFIWMWRAVS